MDAQKFLGLFKEVLARKMAHKIASFVPNSLIPSQRILIESSKLPLLCALISTQSQNLLPSSFSS